MTYRYVDDATTADVAFEAFGETLEDLLLAAWEATMRLMLDNPRALKPQHTRTIVVENDDPEMLLFDILGELIYFKDAEGLLLMIDFAHLEEKGEMYRFEAKARGERIDPVRHRLGVDIKAVTLHQFRLQKIEDGWETRVVLDT